MKKSTLYYSGTAIAWLFSFYWSSIILFGIHTFINFNRSFFPSSGFIFLLTGIFLAKKGNQSVNIEHGRPANAAIPRTKTHNVINAIAISICVIILIIAIARLLFFP